MKSIALAAALLLAVVMPALAAQVETGNAELDSAIEVLMARDFKKKAKALTQIASSGHERRYELLEGILNGSLRVLKRPPRLVFVVKEGRKFAATDALTGESLGTKSSRSFKRLAINNALRGTLETLLATRDLDNEDPEIRLAAVKSLLEKPQAQMADLLRGRLGSEQDPAVREVMESLIAMTTLASEDPEVRLQAIAQLRGNLTGNVRGALERLAVEDKDERVKAKALEAMRSIDNRLRWYGHMETLFFGLSLGSVLALAAFGLAITFGVMGVINMAHGELIMLGAYTAYLLQAALPGMTTLALLLAVPLAFLVSGSAGVLLERTVIRFLYGRPLETLLATFGISLILQQLVRTVISPQNVPVANPEFMSGFVQVNEVFALTYNRLYIIIFTALVFAALFVALKRTRLGLEVRAVSQNRQMAIAMGVKASRVDAMTFGLGSGIAGVAGVALSQLTNVGPNLGQSYIVDSFMVVVFGGVGNLWGTLIGALGLGIANKFMEPWTGAVMAKILVLVIVILFIQKRPRGLFPQKGRAAEG